jgi:hypothetical protein
MFDLLTKQCPAWQGAVFTASYCEEGTDHGQGAVFFFMEKPPSVIMVEAICSCLSLQDNKEKINGR